MVCQGGEDAYYGQEGDQGGVRVPGEARKVLGGGLPIVMDDL